MTRGPSADRNPPIAAARANLVPRLVLLLQIAILAALFAAGDARAQDCAGSQAQLTQAIADSQTALQREDAALSAFDQALIGPRTGPIDTQTAVASRAAIDGFVIALVDFRNKVGPLAQTCGPAFASELQTLDDMIQRFTQQRDRADQLLAAHQALNSSGEPMLTQQQMQAVQQALAAQGYSSAAIDGRFGTATREGIRAWQGANRFPATGYLTGAQAQQLLAAPATVPSQPGQPVTGLPPAPVVGGTTGTQQPPPPAPDAQTQQVCAANTSQLDLSTQRTQEFRQDASARSDTLRNALRGSRTGGFQPGAADDLQADIDGYLDQMVAFQGQAQAVAGRCGAAYDTSLAALGREIDALRQLSDRITQTATDYRALVAAGEPVLSTAQMRAIQQGLTARGHYSGGIDAVFGPGTRNAIRAYQSAVGAQATGYLTPAQAEELQRAAAVQPVQPVEPLPTVEVPETIATAPTAIAIEQVLGQLVDDLGPLEALEPLSGVDEDDGSFGEAYARLHAALDEDRPQPVVDQRFALLGAAYMERSVESVEMVDAHVLVAEAYIALGLYGDAAQQLQRAYATWQKLDDGDPAQAVWLQERLATVRLAQDLADGEVDPEGVETTGQLLAAAREVAERELGSDDPLTLRLVDRQADVAAALGETPEDEEIAAALAARYGG
jgi:peptidoglycan hydrolase-like protein with peptidoglycan-binding domain